MAFVPAFQSESLIVIRNVSNALGRVPVDSVVRLNNYGVQRVAISSRSLLVSFFLISPRLTEIIGLTVVALGSSLSFTFVSGL